MCSANRKSIKIQLNEAGFSNISQKATTLQGTVYKALKKATSQHVIIKVTDKDLHKHSIGLENNKKYHNIKENILSEASILKYLTNQKRSPQSIIKFYSFYECNINYYLIMEDGGYDLFDFIQKGHRLLLEQHVDFCEWLKAVKIIFKQMIDCVEFIHSKNVCHNDVSLENVVINDVKVNYCQNVKNKQSKITFHCADIRVKIIDFGLSTVFKYNFRSNNYCGKTAYKSPEIISKEKTFDAKSNDCWGLGICLFMMVFGCAPWKKADESDMLFVFIMDGHLRDVLESWGLLKNATPEIINLLQLFFRYEDERICLNQIKEHPWMKN